MDKNFAVRSSGSRLAGSTSILNHPNINWKLYSVTSHLSQHFSLFFAKLG
jgi:hypothetical protein